MSFIHFIRFDNDSDRSSFMEKMSGLTENWLSGAYVASIESSDVVELGLQCAEMFVVKRAGGQKKFQYKMAELGTSMGMYVEAILTYLLQGQYHSDTTLHCHEIACIQIVGFVQSVLYKCMLDDQLVCMWSFLMLGAISGNRAFDDGSMFVWLKMTVSSLGNHAVSGNSRSYISSKTTKRRLERGNIPFPVTRRHRFRTRVSRLVSAPRVESSTWCSPHALNFLSDWRFFKIAVGKKSPSNKRIDRRFGICGNNKCDV